MLSRNRMALCVTAGLGLALPHFSRAESGDSKVLLRAQLLKIKHTNEDLQRQNKAMRDDIAELKAMLMQRLSAPAPAPAAPPASRMQPIPRVSTPAPSRSWKAPSPPSTTSDEMTSEEEIRLAREIEAELGSLSLDKKRPVSQSVKRPKAGPRSAAPWNNTRGSRNFWGSGGLPGQTNVIDFGLTSEFIAGRAKERGRSEFTDTFSLRETELAVGGYVDPYHRADMLLIWNDAEDEVAIEEGFMTFFNLPEGFRGRVGKFRSRTGPVNGLHFADLPWIDYPAVHKQFLGEEGFGAAGARLSYLGKPRGKWSWSADLEAFRGDNETLVDPLDLAANKDANGDFDADRFKRDIILSAHVTNHFQLDDANTLELGYSRLQANNDRVKTDGLDITYRYMPQPGRNEWRLQGEYLRQWRADLMGTGDDDRDGWYGWVDRRFHRNFAAGFRVDRTDPFTAGNPQNDGWLAYLTYYPTEFSWYRLQYQEETDGLTNVKDQQVYLQFRWQLGVDRHALQ